MKGKIVLSLLLIFLTACSSGEGNAESSIEITTQNESSAEQAAARILTESETSSFGALINNGTAPGSEASTEKETINPELLTENETGNSETLTENEADNSETLASALGFPVLLPGYDWIKNVVYSQPEEGGLRMDYYDESLGGNCVLTVGRESALAHTDCTFDEAAEETWVGDTGAGQTIYFKVQHSTDGRVVAAEWEYMDYRFVLWANISNENTDTNVVPKIVRCVIGYFGL